MRPTYQILLPLFSLFLVRVDLTDLWPLELKVRLVKVLDGDTLLIEREGHQDKLRLSKIDAPEKGQPFLNSRRDAGLESKKCLMGPLGRRAQFFIQIEKRDIYGRLLGDLEGLSLKLVEAGCTGLYPHAVFANRQEKYRYLRALEKAQRERKGIWKFGGFLRPKLWRKKFKTQTSHRPWRR